MMSGGASVEDTLELWASSLRDVNRIAMAMERQDKANGILTAKPLPI
jgi:hypothetical protein